MADSSPRTFRCGSSFARLISCKTIRLSAVRTGSQPIGSISTLARLRRRSISIPKPQPCLNIQTGIGSLTVRGMPFNQFTPYLSPYVNRVIVDRTGLDGRYDIDLKWTPESAAQGRGSNEPPAADPNAVSIFTALQEQLGLRLNSTRETVDVLVIDTLERPTEN